MTVKAWLEGRDSDLEVVARHFSTGEPAVYRDVNGDYYLTSSSFEELWDRGELPDAAETLLTQINGLARVFEPNYRPVQLGVRFSDDGGRGQMVALKGAIEISVAASATISINGVPQEPPPSRAPDFIQEAAQNPDVAEALRILGAAGHSAGWHDLYKVFEIVRSNVGGGQALISQGWKTREDISAFTVSANSPSVSGDAARHARHNDGVPQHTMNLPTGRAFISQLMLRWLDSLNRSK